VVREEGERREQQVEAQERERERTRRTRGEGDYIRNISPKMGSNVRGTILVLALILPSFTSTKESTYSKRRKETEEEEQERRGRVSKQQRGTNEEKAKKEKKNIPSPLPTSPLASMTKEVGEEAKK
jgi:hypothetical protein